MILSQLILQNFRSHRDRTIELGPVTAIVGPNGVGKTNILEAVWVLATTRSFRTNRELDLVHWDEGHTEITGGDYMIRIVREPSYQKGLFIRGVPHRTVEYLGELPAVLFTPDSLKIATGTPADRRRFLDTIVAQQSKDLARTLLRYRQVVIQRNALLRLIRDHRSRPADLEPWDEQLINLGMRIIQARRLLADQLMERVGQRYAQLANRPAEPLELVYRATSGDTEDDFRGRLARQREREIALQTTLVGPHRDDIEFLLRGRLLEYASRGEVRTVMLALKWSECEVVAQGGQIPLLLLDDLFSELDQHHREAIAGLLQTTQSLCTTTDLSHIPTSLTGSLRLVEL